MPDSELLDFQRTGIFKARAPVADSVLNLLKTEYGKVLNSERRMHYNHLAGLHNPWGKSAHLFDSWALLDICQSEAMLELIAPLIGPDIILWESAFYGYNALAAPGAWTRHSDFSPIDPMMGVTVRIAIETNGPALDYLPGSHTSEQQDNAQEMKTVAIESGEILCHDIRLAHRYAKAKSGLQYGEYVIHYMPATSLFVRDPASAIQKLLAEKLPLINYGKSPIWLVSGNDWSNNDFVTGFAPPVGQWTNAQW